MQIIEIETEDGATSYEFVRWVTDSAGGVTQKSLGRMAAGSRTIPDAILKQCTKDERYDIAHWLMSRMEGEGMRRIKGLIAAAPAELVELRVALTSNLATAEQLDAIMHEMAEIAAEIGRQQRRSEGALTLLNGSSQPQRPVPAFRVGETPVPASSAERTPTSAATPTIPIAALLSVNADQHPAPAPKEPPPQILSLTQIPSFLRALQSEPPATRDDSPRGRLARKP
jgi:hypothetical protein